MHTELHAASQCMWLSYNYLLYLLKAFVSRGFSILFTPYMHKQSVYFESKENNTVRKIGASRCDTCNPDFLTRKK